MLKKEKEKLREKAKLRFGRTKKKPNIFKFTKPEDEITFERWNDDC